MSDAHGFCGPYRKVGSVALLLVFSIFQAQAANPARLPLRQNQNLASFQAYEGETFRVHGGPGARWVEEVLLEQVIDQGSTKAVEQFWVRFRAPADSTLSKNTYFFEHPEAGKFRLWLVPVRANKPGRFFDARFNLMMEATSPN